VQRQLHKAQKDAAAREARLGSRITELNRQLARAQAALEKAQQQQSVAVTEAARQEVAAEMQAQAEEQARLRASAHAEKRDWRRRAENAEDFSEKRLQRTKAAEARVEELLGDLEELKEMLEEAQSAKQSPALRAANGRLAAYPWKLRVTAMAALSRGTPPSAVPQNLVEAAHLLLPAEEAASFHEPSVDVMRRTRQEVTILGETLSAYVLADCKRVISFGFDETTKLQVGLLATNAQVEDSQGNQLDVVMRGGAVIPGGTAQQVVQAIETRFWAHGRKLLLRWRAVHEEKNGAGSWPGPSPSDHGAHKLAGTLLINDTCPTARCTARLLEELVAAAVEAHMGPEAWTQLGEAERKAKMAVYLGDCWQHMRNIFLDHMARQAEAHLQEELAESLQNFSSYERMTTNGMQLIRAVYKHLHPGGDYAKGNGVEFDSWRLEDCKSVMFMRLERAAGGRQDLEFDGSLPIFVNRPVLLQYLAPRCLAPGHENVLESFLWSVLSSVEMGALLRVNTLFDLLLSRPMRFLCGSSAQLTDWSIYSMGAVLDEIAKGLDEIASDGHRLLDPELDLFAGVAANQPAFGEWRAAEMQHVIKSPDGASHLVYQRALSEARQPTHAANTGTTDLTVELAEVMAAAALHKIRDPKLALSDWLTSGKNSIGQNAAAHAATVGAHTTNDRVESIFGCFDYFFRRFLGMSPEAAAGMALMMRMHFLDRPSQVLHDRRKSKAEAPPQRTEGLFWKLPEPMQESLVEAARRQRVAARKEARVDRAEQLQYRRMKREENLEKQRLKTVDLYARALELFPAWQARGVCKPADIKGLLNGKSDAQQRAALREQIEMRVIGLGMIDFETAWSSKADESVGSVEHLSGVLRKILMEEQEMRGEGRLPDEAVPPVLKVKTLKTLGTPTAHAEELQQDIKVGAAQLKEAAIAEQKRKVEACITDDVADVMPIQAPGLTTAALSGRRLEICWGTYYVEGKKERVKMWCPCTVKKVADGESNKGSHGKAESDRARKILPAGALLVEWEPDHDRGEEKATVMWLVLSPDKWNKDSHLAWRWHPAELQKVQEQDARKRART